ncbi:putative reverse transcriptase domain-containing protein [Tanacetum coccineum]|uniref:Reverse transcriptase domain-containing protein n=1 Tax=Tanacetum coccineum TaxID=301880 RepID=A0ABQ5GWM0_9ASTR
MISTWTLVRLLFIKNFSKIVKPLASLTQKNQKYERGGDQEEDFQTLKDNLCNVPILSLPDGPEDFIVNCDASNQGLGCVLMKRGKDKILAAPGEASKIENATTEMMCGLGQVMERKEDGADKTYYDLRDMYGGHVDWTRIGQEMTDKVVLVKEKLKAARDRQRSYADNRRKLLKFEKYLADANLHVHLEEIKVDKTLRFVEEPVEIIDREVKSLKRSRIWIVKVHWNSKRGHEDFIKTKYLHLLVEQAIVGSTK